MTKVQIDLRLPDEVSPAVGTLLFFPTRRLNFASYTVLPDSIVVPLENGKATVDLRPTGIDWAWNVLEKVKHGIRRTVAVPDTENINYSDLVNVAPGTLQPTAEPEAAWWVALDELTLGGGGPEGGALAAHIGSPTPHPEYDDLPSLTLLFENGII